MASIGGMRPFGLAKYLSSFGWNPIILTPMLPGDPDPKLCIIQTPYNDVVGQWKKRFGMNPKKSLNAQLHISRKKESERTKGKIK